MTPPAMEAWEKAGSRAIPSTQTYRTPASVTVSVVIRLHKGAFVSVNNLL